MSREELLALAERCEQATGLDRELDRDIVLGLYPDAIVEIYLVGDDEPSVFHARPLVEDKHELPRFTASLDAAMSLADEPNIILAEAMKRLASKFGLHVTFWPVDKSYSEWLARFVAAASLRSRAAMGEGL